MIEESNYHSQQDNKYQNQLDRRRSSAQFQDVSTMINPSSTHLTRNASYSMPHESQINPQILAKIAAMVPYNSDNKKKFFRVDHVLKLKKKPDPLEEEQENEIRKNLQLSPEIVKEDLQNKPLVGPQAVQLYYQHYKKVNKVRQQNDFFKISDSVQTAMLRQAEQIDVLPCKIGVVKTKGSEQSLQISHQKYGDRYASMLSEGLKVNPNIKDFYMANNRIQSSGATQILNQIGKVAKVLDLQQNNIGKIGTDSICQQIQSRENKLEVLNLEDNKLGDRNVTRILKALLNSNNKLKSLNVSKNYLTNDIAEILKESIIQLDNMEQLYIHWNQIKGWGGQKIFEALIENKTLLVFDAGWNSFGIQERKDVQCIQKICDFLITNKNVLHCDLSSNQFSLNDCKLIANALKQNRTIYGFHFVNNWGIVDARGFLQIQENELQRVLGETPRIKGLQQTTTIRQENVCWICEGWQEQKFIWTPDVSGEGEADPLFIHLDFEAYKQVYIPKNQDEISLTLMIPTNTTQYIYTMTDTQLIANDQSSIPYGHQLKINYNNNYITVLMENINYVKKDKHFLIFDQVEFKPQINVLPRTPDPVYIPPKLKKQKRIWTFPISIWAKDFKFENEDLLKKCFEKDFTCSKISKVVKNPDELLEIKNVLWAHYKLIKETYKQYSSNSPTGDIWSISSNVITEFAQQTELIDGKTLKLSDLDLKFIATCAASIEYKGNFRNPERSLCRFQFMEFLVRVSEDKYLKTKVANNMLEATKMILEQCKSYMSTFDAQKWRNERYFNEQCDDCLKFFKPLLNHLYNKYSVKKVKPGQKKFMCLDEIHEICSQANLYDERFVERDADNAFNLSMMLQVDELESDRIFQMTFIEFLEAVARIADKVSMPGIDAVDLTWDQRVTQPLHLKLEKILIHLANTCASEEFKLQYGNINKSMFAIVEEDD
ncbi:unnamed protein product [Paramecium pentaurelia]|uniref:Leucine Rich Repeat family protein n=1 Tax=Paramecium pentaurelia TaxID=43138 RepID=A0A8S1V3Y7_9CILI|nr:unnamed protein product [Paramecium pentaurelia]